MIGAICIQVGCRGITPLLSIVAWAGSLCYDAPYAPLQPFVCLPPMPSLARRWCSLHILHDARCMLILLKSALSRSMLNMSILSCLVLVLVLNGDEICSAFSRCRSLMSGNNIYRGSMCVPRVGVQRRRCSRGGRQRGAKPDSHFTIITSFLK
jgi:hypothetical protein